MKRAADGDCKKMEERLTALARAGATPGARAKAAEFVIERLMAARAQLGELEKAKHAQELELQAAQQQLIAERQRADGASGGGGGGGGGA
eukprot:662002-Prymnesium_polylepis.1